MIGSGHAKTIAIRRRGYAYRVLNRAVGSSRIFRKEQDFEVFEEAIDPAKQRLPMRVLGWCLMPNQWHFVLWPRGDGELSELRLV